MASAAFTKALAWVLKAEGLVYTANLLDRGGPTKMGITLGTLAGWRKAQGKPVPTAADVAALTQAEASAIYEALYWRPVRGDDLSSPGVAITMMDTAVLCGPSRAIKLAQMAAEVVVDGAFGPKTLAAINAMQPEHFLLEQVDHHQEYLLNIVLNDPSQVTFYRNWRTRAADHLALALPI